MAKKNIYIENQYHYGETIGYISKKSEFEDFLSSLVDNASDLDDKINEVKKNVSTNTKVNVRQDNAISKNYALDKRQGNAINSNVKAINSNVKAIQTAQAMSEANAQDIAANTADIDDLVNKTNGIVQGINRINEGIMNYVKPTMEHLEEHMTDIDEEQEEIRKTVSSYTSSIQSLNDSMESISLSGDGIDYTLFVDGEDRGSVHIPQDRIKAITYDDETHELTFVFVSKDQENTIIIPLENLSDVYTSGQGIELKNNVFSIKLDNNSEAYLSVSESGLSLNGIDEIIDTISSITETYDEDIETIVTSISNLDDVVNGIALSQNDLEQEMSGLTKALEEEVNRAKGEEQKNAQQISTTTDLLLNHIESESAITANIDSLYEITNNLSNSISTETERAINIEETLNDKILKEIARATSAETELNNLLSNEIERSTEQENSLYGAIADISSAMTDVVEEIHDIESGLTVQGEEISTLDERVEALENQMSGVVEINEQQQEKIDFIENNYALKSDIPQSDDYLTKTGDVLSEDSMQTMYASGFKTKADLEAEIEAHIEQKFADVYVSKQEYDIKIADLQAQIDALRNIIDTLL